MKHRHQSTVEKKSATIIIHTTIRSSSSMRAVDNKPVNRDKNLSSVSATRNTLCRRNELKRISVVPAVDENLMRKKDAISSIKTNQNNQHFQETHENKTKTGKLTESLRQQSNNSSTLIKEKVKNGQKYNHENCSTSEKTLCKSIKMNQLEKNILDRKITQVNDHNDAKMRCNRTEPVNEHHKKSKRNNEKKYVMSSFTQDMSIGDCYRYFGYYCCTCSRLCPIISFFACLLLGMMVATIVIALLPKTKVTTVVSTLTTTTVSTSTITTITSSTASTSTTTVSTSTTSTTTSSTTTSSTTTVTTTLPTLSIGTNDTLYGIWNTTAGDDSTLATAGTGVGNYYPGEDPPHAFDNNCSTKFTSFGECIFNPPVVPPNCGINTGFYVTLHSGAAVMKGLRFCTGNDNPPRDPITMTLEGSNQNGTTLMLGSSWSLIYNGSCGLDIDPGRGALGQTQTFSNNSVAYSSYRILITSKRATDYALQYSELELLGY